MAKDQSWIADLLIGEGGGSGGSGSTTTAAAYNQPSLGSTVSVPLADTTIAIAGKPLTIAGNDYVVTTTPVSGSVTIRNTGGTNNSLPGTAIALGSVVTNGGGGV